MTIFNKYYMIVIDQERRMVIAIGTRYSQEFKEDAVRYRLEHPEIALRKYNSMLTLIVHFYFPLNVHIYFIIYNNLLTLLSPLVASYSYPIHFPFCQMQGFHPTCHKISFCLLLFSALLFNILCEDSVFIFILTNGSLRYMTLVSVE